MTNLNSSSQNGNWNDESSRPPAFISNRGACGNKGSIQNSFTPFQSTENLSRLRKIMIQKNISAYIVTSSDDHQVIHDF